MSTSTSPSKGRHQVAALLFACALPLASALVPAPAQTRLIENTAVVTYVEQGAHAESTVSSNTVRTKVLPTPSSAALAFLRYAADDDDGVTSTRLDGGQCRREGGSFIPLPRVVGLDGNPLDGETPGTIEAPAYYAGEPVVLSVTDANRNSDASVREYVDIDLTTQAGDAETLRLRETGPDTGVFAAAIQSVPAPPDATRYDCVLSLPALTRITASYTDSDFPIDAQSAFANAYAAPTGAMALRLVQSVSRELVEIGDFLQYTLLVSNPNEAPAYKVRLKDVLPAGIRYRQGSARTSLAANPAPGLRAASATTPPARVEGEIAPALEADGRTLVFPVGTLAPGGAATVTFVAEVGAGARGQFLRNEAVAVAAASLRSNETDTVVRMRESLLTSRFTLVGNVIEAECASAPGERKGIAGIRVQLEDGTFAITDNNGAYHFEGLRAGTHVVQVDLASLPGHLEMAPCGNDTRSAGRDYSRFVEVQGGGLWRADFKLRRRAPQTGVVGSRLQVSPRAGTLHHAVLLDGGEVPVSGLKGIVVVPMGSRVVPGSATVDGTPADDPEMAGNIAVFALGDPGAGWQRRVEFELQPPSECPEGGYRSSAMAVFSAGGQVALRTPQANVDLPCAVPASGVQGPRTETRITAAAEAASSSPGSPGRAPVADDAHAAGMGIDWFHDATPGTGWLFPAADYNPRMPVTGAVVKYPPGGKVVLKSNGVPVAPLYYEGSKTAKGIAVATWARIPLADGDTLLEAEVRDAAGNLVETLSRTVHYATAVARAEFLPEQSRLVADGIQAPVLAVRLLDAQGHPVRKGLYGEYQVSAPYLPVQTARQMQERQLAGHQGAAQTWIVHGDDGIAYIELQATSVAGSGTLSFEFGQERATQVRQELQFWLKSAPRDWIIVGFAAGSVGYETLRDNMQALDPADDGSGVRADGQVAFYAKGRILGSWLLTLAYDSDKPTDELRGRSLLSTIDPQQYYSLYGDGTSQGYDAASADKLYLKLEHDQFYALFGDFQTNLDRNELSRYQRTLNGIKVEYRGALLEFNGFAAKTSQNHVRDEIQGDGTSGLYRLSHHGIVMNGERVRIETRDRFHSEQVIETRQMARHLDYDIDYDNGTLFFRQPVASRDFDFNPIYIVVEYETFGTTDEYLNAGGRLGVRLLENRLEAGVTRVRDEDAAGRTGLTGVDARFRLTQHDEVRAEAAMTRGRSREGDSEGSAWLLEWEHRGARFDLLAYARRNEPGFGLGQQNRSESGTFKAGAQGQWRVDEHFSLQGEAYRLENLATAAVRDAAHVAVAYNGGDWSARAGLQLARDEAADGRVAESRLATLGASRYFFDRRLELSAQADLSLGGKNESVDFPTRLQLGAAYRINEAFRVVAAQEYTDGEDRDTATTRFGFEATPWANAQLTSTLNQSRITEYGPRTFALFGLNQRFQLGERWGLDLAVDSSHSFNQSGQAPLVVDPAQPVASGGIRDGGALTEDFVALSGGATYRADLWSWNVRAEARRGDANDRYGFTSAFLRQARDGVAFSASVQAFSQQNADGSTGLLANAQLAWAYRPLGSAWSILDKLEFRLDQVTRGAGDSIVGQDTIAAVGNARSRRLVNNFVLNHVSDAWEAGDGAGNVLDIDQRSQLSMYYGSKYVLDSFGPDDYAGYTDIIGVEWRFDIAPRVDIGLRSSVIHSWSQESFAWAFGPSLGFSPFTNAWVSVGYNIRGFNDRDFENAHHTAQGPYLVLRMKFDQDTFGLAPEGGVSK